jgi:hypothetical protein
MQLLTCQIIRNPQCRQHHHLGMPFSGMLHRVALVRTSVSEEHIASIIRVTRIG